MGDMRLLYQKNELTVQKPKLAVVVVLTMFCYFVQTVVFFNLTASRSVLLSRAYYLQSDSD